MKRRSKAHLLRKAKRHVLDSALWQSYDRQLVAAMHRTCGVCRTVRHGETVQFKPSSRLVSRAFAQRERRRQALALVRFWKLGDCFFEELPHASDRGL